MYDGRIKRSVNVTVLANAIDPQKAIINCDGAVSTVYIYIEPKQNADTKSMQASMGQA